MPYGLDGIALEQALERSRDDRTGCNDGQPRRRRLPEPREARYVQKPAAPAPCTCGDSKVCRQHPGLRVRRRREEE